MATNKNDTLVTVSTEDVDILRLWKKESKRTIKHILHKMIEREEIRRLELDKKGIDREDM